MAKSYISKQQLVKLQTLYGQRATVETGHAPSLRDAACGVSTRAARLAWVSDLLGREVRSFNELTRREAAKAIDALSSGRDGACPVSTVAAEQAAGKQTQGPSAPAGRGAQDDNATNQARGTEGRKPKAAGRDGACPVSTMAGAEDIARIEDALTRLGWDQKRLEAWLRSPSSPLARKVAGGRSIAPSNPKIRTVGEANRVWWGLKRLLKRAGCWQPAAGSKQVQDQEAKGA